MGIKRKTMKTGDKVMCINDSGSWPDGKPVKDFIEKGSIYKVSDVFEGVLSVLACSIEGCETSWMVSRFRKIEDNFTNSITKELAENYKDFDKLEKPIRIFTTNQKL